MLHNQQFVDPVIAQQIHKLQKQYNILATSRQQILSNNNLAQQKKQKLLKYNQQQLIKIQSIMNKTKSKMVDYFDSQLLAVSKQQIQKGVKVDCNNKNNPINNCSKLQKQLVSKQQQQPLFKQQYSINIDAMGNSSNFTIGEIKDLTATTFCGQSLASTNCISRLNSGGMLSSSVSSRRTRSNSNHSLNNPHTLTNIKNSSGQQQQISNVSSFNLTQVGHQSDLMTQNANVNIQKVPVTRYLQQHSSLLSPIFNQQQDQLPYQQQQLKIYQSLSQINQLNIKKIDCLAQKCSKLQQQNTQLRQLVQYQSHTIEQLNTLLQQQQRGLQLNNLNCQLQSTNSINNNTTSIQLNNNQQTQKPIDLNTAHQCYQNITQSLQQSIDRVLTELSRQVTLSYKQCQYQFTNLHSDSNYQLEEFYSQVKRIIKQFSSKAQYIKKTALSTLINDTDSLQQLKAKHCHQVHNRNCHQGKQPNTQQLNSSAIYSDLYENNKNNSRPNHANNLLYYNYNIQSLAQQLTTLQQTLHKIQLQNQQLRSERSLLLKKIKIQY